MVMPAMVAAGRASVVMVLTRRSVSPIEDLATRNCDMALKA
jgi:hypothetical protein